MTGPTQLEQPNGVKAGLTAAGQGPAWLDVDPRAVVVQLTNQLAGILQQMAMKDAYIDQLHQALSDLAGVVPGENNTPPA